MDKNAFLYSGPYRAVQAINKRAEQEINDIEACQLTDQEKQAKIEEIKGKRDAELAKLKDARILWGKR